MRDFMDYIASAFYTATGWNHQSSYSTLNSTADALLNFPIPRGLRLTLSSLATPHFATSYQLGTVGVVDGSISYLFSTAPLGTTAAIGPGAAQELIARSDQIPLPALLRSYRPLADLSTKGHDGLRRSSNRRNPWQEAVNGKTLAYGRMYLPQSMLEALVVKRISPRTQLQVSAVSDQTLRNGGTILGMWQYDVGRYGIEGLASTDGGLLGVRGLYNFGGDKKDISSTSTSDETWHGAGEKEKEKILGRFSAGAELYYGTLNRTGGMSIGGRFATLPEYKGTPHTSTVTINPLMGNISSTFAVMAGRYCSLASRFEFNVYSYESDWSIGMELWRKSPIPTVESGPGSSPSPPASKERSFAAKMAWRLDDDPLLASPIFPDASSTETAITPLTTTQQPLLSTPKIKERSFQAKMEWRLDDETTVSGTSLAHDDGDDVENYSGVLKARVDQHLRIGLLWEGRVKSLLFSLGSAIDLRKMESPFRTVGLEVQFST